MSAERELRFTRVTLHASHASRESRFMQVTHNASHTSHATGLGRDTVVDNARVQLVLRWCFAACETNCWNGVTLCNDSYNLFRNGHRRGFTRINIYIERFNWLMSTNRCWTSYTNYCAERCYTGHSMSAAANPLVYYLTK